MKTYEDIQILLDRLNSCGVSLGLKYEPANYWDRYSIEFHQFNKKFKFIEERHINEMAYDFAHSRDKQDLLPAFLKELEKLKTKLEEDLNLYVEMIGIINHAMRPLNENT